MKNTNDKQPSARCVYLSAAAINLLEQNQDKNKRLA